MGEGYFVGIVSMFGKYFLFSCKNRQAKKIGKDSLKNNACRNNMTAADFDAVKKEKGINYMQEKMKYKILCGVEFRPYFCAGEMAERSNAAVLKTVEVKASGGSNPSLSALLQFKKN